MSSTPRERKLLQLQRNHDDPDRKFRSFDLIYMFDQVDVSVIIDDYENVWFKGIDLARALEMEDPSNAICKTIDNKYCQSYDALSSSLPKYRNIPGMHPKTTFVNETGMNLFIIRSRKPKAESFAEWVCGVVLPSIRKTNKYEIDPVDNPYRKMCEMLSRENEEIKVRCTSLENDKSIITKEKSILQNRYINLENLNARLYNDVSRYAQNLLEMKPSCVPILENEVKQEYFVLYRKYNLENNNISPTIINSSMPYYACRVQLDSLEQRRQELLEIYPDLTKLLQLAVPNSVTFFNYVLERMPEFIERDTKGQSFCIHNISENQMLTMIENLYRTHHGMDPRKT